MTFGSGAMRMDKKWLLLSLAIIACAAAEVTVTIIDHFAHLDPEPPKNRIWYTTEVFTTRCMWAPTHVLLPPGDIQQRYPVASVWVNETRVLEFRDFRVMDNCTVDDIFFGANDTCWVRDLDLNLTQYGHGAYKILCGHFGPGFNSSGVWSFQAQDGTTGQGQVNSNSSSLVRLNGISRIAALIATVIVGLVLLL